MGTIGQGTNERLKYWWTIAYLPLYLIAFGIVEARQTEFTEIRLAIIDDCIPFVEAFIVPYLLWFPYIAVTFCLFFFKDKREYLQYMGFLYIGMTIFIFVSFVFPNGLKLRPETMPRDNIFTRQIALLYSTDTPTNVIPSIHVYNSIAAAVAAVRSERVFCKRYQKVFCILFSLTIILSTMFIKQHSVIDVTAAILLCLPVYLLIYGRRKVKNEKPSGLCLHFVTKGKHNSDS